MSRTLLNYLAKFHNIDTALFEHEAEWLLWEGVCCVRVPSHLRQRLEALAASI